MLIALLRSLRPGQWVKNLFVLAPLVFSHHLMEPTSLGRAGLGALIFCLLSGTVYLMNDVFDVEKDRAHPTKRERPIASGALPIRLAAVSGILIGLGSLAGAFALDLWFGGVAVTYLTINVLYSWRLKHVVFLDVVTIALGFLLRTLAGAFAIDVQFSEWLFVCTFLLALYLALGKRLHEVMQAGLEGGKQRKVLERYRADHLRVVMLTVAALTLGAYTAYALRFDLPLQEAPPTRAAFESPWLPVTVPFAMMGVGRFFQLVNRSEDPRSPTERMIRDLPFIANLAVWGIAILVLIYI